MEAPEPSGGEDAIAAGGASGSAPGSTGDAFPVERLTPAEQAPTPLDHEVDGLEADSEHDRP